MAEDDHKMDPGRAQQALRWPQEDPKDAHGRPMKPNIGEPKTLKKLRKIDGLASRGPPSEPNIAQDGPKQSLRSPKLSSREAQGGPKRLQGALKTLQIPTGGLTSQKC